jgi:hypothetical protein
MMMSEHLDKVKTYWDLFDELSVEEQGNYIWTCWGETIIDIVREWEDETLSEAITELKETLEAKQKCQTGPTAPSE